MKLAELLAEFEGADPEESLEMLVDFSERLPPAAPGRDASAVNAGCRIQECQTPVYLWVDVAEGKVRLEAVVPEQSPTVRGFVALLVEGISGAEKSEVAGLPDDFLPLLGLSETLGMTRRRGFQGIISRIKREVAQKT
ncbi:MAG: SufE family protein [Planctomycetia bacterium]|nr:SufE family protein [Planctomycetia bacterium]